jgi:hypothetical protein
MITPEKIDLQFQHLEPSKMIQGRTLIGSPS